LHKVKLDEGDHKFEGWGMLEHSKHPKSESVTAKSESVHHAEGQAEGLASNLSYTRHHGEEWLEVKLEVNQGWKAEMTQIDSNNHQRGLIINSTEISAESLKSN
jgi:cytochrome c biogenesis protein ResB